MLTDVQRKLWEAYESAERRASRDEKLRALDAFLVALVASPAPDWFAWARSIAEQVVDHGENLVIRRPLFERAVFPALLAGYHARLPGNARWLAGLSQQLLRCPECREKLRPEETTEQALLLAAIRHDPTDRRSRFRLIEKIADRLRFSLHEVPSGVLYGMDGASPQECDDLERELDAFCRFVEQEGMNDRFADLIRACRFHFRGYRDYLLNRESYESYAAYLSEHPAEGGS